MSYNPDSPFLQQLRGRITLEETNSYDPRFAPSDTDTQGVPFSGCPFSERGSRLMVFRRETNLYIRLAERWTQWEDEVGDYRRRSPIIQELTFTDADGTPLAFSLTAYPHALWIETRCGEFWITFIDEESLYIKLPCARGGISFRVYATHGRVDRRGGEFKGDPGHRDTHRNVAYTTNARILANGIEPDTDGYLRVRLQAEAEADAGLVLNITPRLGFNRSMPPSARVLRDAEQRWHTWFAAAPVVDEKYAAQYYYAWWILRMGLLSPRFFLTREAMMPSVIHYVGVWQWDAFFHALAYQHVDLKLAEDQLRVVLDHQREDGMIPDAVYDEGIVTRWKLAATGREVDVTKPPLIAWAALKLYATSGHRDFLEEIYAPICRSACWWFDQNDDDHDGVMQYGHPFSSGLDDSPLWDDGMPVESPDINTYPAMQSDALARIAEILGLTVEAAQWRVRAETLVQKMIAHFWDADTGMFLAMHDHKPVRALTPFNLYPLLTGRLPREMVERLVAHLLAPDEFATAYPIPTVARRDPKYDPSQMWRGPTWVNINYLFIEGLVRSGYPDLARNLRDQTLALLMRHNDIYEYYNPETGDPPPRAASVFGWSSAVFIDLAIKASRGEIV